MSTTDQTTEPNSHRSGNGSWIQKIVEKWVFGQPAIVVILSIALYGAYDFMTVKLPAISDRIAADYQRFQKFDADERHRIEERFAVYQSANNDAMKLIAERVDANTKQLIEMNHCMEMQLQRIIDP